MRIWIKIIHLLFRKIYENADLLIYQKDGSCDIFCVSQEPSS
ncbi:MAG: hypothetical protein JG777_684 [Clostridia bacterium]|jgi:hypothetical protein|nr:hypothetical protein [Clostridia bacterium]